MNTTTPLHKRPIAIASAVALLHPRDVEVAAKALATAYRRETGSACDIRTIVPSGGAVRIRLTGRSA